MNHMFVYVLPGKNTNNTYIELFKRSIKTASPELTLVDLPTDDLWYVVRSVWRTARAKHIVHIHWPTILYGSAFTVKSLYLLVRNGILLALLKGVLRVRVVWTVHNAFAHDYPHPWIDRIGTALVRSCADVILLQQRCTKSAYERFFPRKRLEYLPHGSYEGVYGPRQERRLEWRERLGFLADDIVLLSLGVIAPYKRNEEIIRAVLEQSHPRVRLLIAGKGDKTYIDRLKALAGGSQRIHIQDEFIPNEEIATYLANTDYAVFFYDDSEMTSGGMVLALSYGVPVLTRQIPAAELITEKNGKVFRSRSELVTLLDGLTKHAYTADSVQNTVRGTEWSTVGKQLIRIYQSL